MDRSYPYSRRLVSRARLRKRMAAVAAAVLAAAAGVFTLAWTPDPVSAALPGSVPALAFMVDASGADEPVRRGVRRIYPYSVVPGGVFGQAELKRIIRTDSVVAAHYASFDAGKARAVVVDKPRAVHVSYRKGDKVYWTAHKVMLAPGETLLSDGSNEMRARCANRISDIPQFPVEAHRPAMAELDQAVELADGEDYTLGPDGMPVAMGGIARHAGVHFALRGGSGGGADGVAADVILTSTLSSSAAGGMGPVTTTGLSGSSSSMGNLPRPSGRPASTPATEPATPAATETVPDTGSGGNSGSNGVPTGTGEPATTPAPATTPPSGPSPGGAADDPQPAPVPVTEGPAIVPSLPAGPSTGKDPEGGTGLLPAEPASPKEPAGPRPEPTQPPAQTTIEPPPPTEVPEPGSLWLFVIALASLGVLRRPRAARADLPPAG